MISLSLIVMHNCCAHSCELTNRGALADICTANLHSGNGMLKEAN